LDGSRHRRRITVWASRLLRQAKIQNLDVAALGHEDVCRLDVPVNNSLAVGGTKRIPYLTPPFKHLRKRQRPPGHVMLQSGAFHQFHGDKHVAVLFANLVDHANVRMVERGCGTRLSLKSFQNLWIPGQVVRKKFERDKPAKGRILRLIDGTHPAAAQHFNDSVVGYDLADHGADDGEAATYKLIWLQVSLFVIQEIVDTDEWNVQRIGVSLLGFQKPFQVGL
jgi:hypothetical protein